MTDDRNPFDRLTDAFSAEHADLEHDLVQSKRPDARPSTPAWWAQPAVALGAVVFLIVGALVLAQVLSRGDDTQGITVAAEATAEPAVSAQATVAPRVTVRATVSPTPVPTPLQMPELTPTATPLPTQSPVPATPTPAPALPLPSDLPETELNACTEGVTPADHDVVGVGTPGGESPVDHVRDLRVYESADCTTIVIEMGEGWTADAESRPSNYLRSGIVVGGGRGATSVVFDDWFNVDAFFRSQEVTWDGGVALVAGGVGKSQVWIANGSPAAPTVSVLSKPARIVVGITPASDVVMFEPLTQIADGRTSTDYYLDVLTVGPTAGEVFVHGFGRAFESSGTASVFSDGAPVNPTFSGDSIVFDFGKFRTGNPGVAWSEFSFTIEGLAPGDYELVLDSCDQCDPPEVPASIAFTVPPL